MGSYVQWRWEAVALTFLIMFVFLVCPPALVGYALYKLFAR